MLLAAAAEIEEINSTTKAEMEYLTKSTAEQEEQNTKQHESAVRCLFAQSIAYRVM
eukprot:SAG31_NODE_802_length_12008_cov_18.741036_13_plen_56_part_00